MEEALRVSLRFLELVHNYTDINSLLTAFVSEIKNYAGCEAVGSGGSMPTAGFLTRPLMVSVSNSMNRKAPYPSEPISACVLTLSKAIVTPGCPFILPAALFG